MKKHFQSERHFALAASYPSDEEARHARLREDYNTTRRYCRTLAEAFPDERAPAIVMPPRRPPILTRYSVTAAIVLVAVGILVVMR